MNVMLALIFVLAQTAAPLDATGWYDRGAQLFDAGNYTAAIDAFTKARDMGYAQRPQLNLRIARAQVRAGQNAAALVTLKTMTGNGYAQVEALLAENDLLPLRTENAWEEIVAGARSNQRPCEKDPLYRQFDYWLGEWDVEVQGQRVARSSVQLILGDCALYENYWRLDGTYSGKSFSVWDSPQKRWEQRYVDTTGSSSDWFGKLEADRMVFYLRPDANGGGNAVQRMTYIKEGPDRVRQAIDVSTDGEKTWNSAFDGLYVRRK